MLIGLNGVKGSGKDTVGERLIEKYDFERLSFAAKLKESAAALFDVETNLWEHLKNNPSASIVIQNNSVGIKYAEVTVREFLQKYGTEAHRDIFGYNFWVDHAFKGINPRIGNYVVTDCRFENEIDKIHSLGGVVVRILRDNLDESDTHASEVAPPPHKVDYFFDNSGTLEDLYRGVDFLHEFLLGEENDFGEGYED